MWPIPEIRLDPVLHEGYAITTSMKLNRWIDVETRQQSFIREC